MRHDSDHTSDARSCSRGTGRWKERNRLPCSPVSAGSQRGPFFGVSLYLSQSEWDDGPRVLLRWDRVLVGPKEALSRSFQGLAGRQRGDRVTRATPGAYTVCGRQPSCSRGAHLEIGPGATANQSDGLTKWPSKEEEPRAPWGGGGSSVWHRPELQMEVPRQPVGWVGLDLHCVAQQLVHVFE